MKNTIKTFMKGFLMGTCDIVPGISGGTIAFITGIYIRFINSTKNITPKNILKIFTELTTPKKLNKTLKELDFYFLLTLLLGILTAIFSASKIISTLLKNYPSYTLAFFVGLILASTKIIFKDIQNHNKTNYAFGVIGFIIGLILIFLTKQNIQNPSYFLLFFSGFIAISAMFLPGISGSFILLIIGTYEYIINAIHNIQSNISQLITFTTGLILGMYFISRIISYLYKKDKSKTLYTLFGLIIGALSIPIKNSIISLPEITPLYLSILLGFVIEGFLIVLLIETLSKNKV